jgi:hypothetical protein
VRLHDVSDAMSVTPPPPSLVERNAFISPPKAMRGGLEFAPDPSSRGSLARIWVLRFMGAVGFISLVSIVQARAMNRIENVDWVWPAQRERKRVERIEEAKNIIEAQRKEAAEAAAAVAEEEEKARVQLLLLHKKSTADANNNSSCVIS